MTYGEIRNAVGPSMNCRRAAIDLSLTVGVLSFVISVGAARQTTKGLQWLSSEFEPRKPGDQKMSGKVAANKNEIKGGRQSSDTPPGQRRVIFPSLYSESCAEKGSDEIGNDSQADKGQPCHQDSDDHAPPQLLLSPSVFPIRSPGLLPTHSSRLCQELGLDVPEMSLSDVNSKRLPLVPSLPPKSRSSLPTVTKKGRGRTLRNMRGEAVTSKFSNKGRPSPMLERKVLHTHPYITGSPQRPASFLSNSTMKSCGQPQSILKSKKSKIGHLASLPSLVPMDEDSNSSNETLLSLGSEQHGEQRSVSFDPRIWVVEFKRSNDELEKTWFSPEELDHFRRETIARLVAHHTELLPSGTGYVVKKNMQPTKAVFAMPALSLDSEETNDNDIEEALREEIKNVLIVDPHDICLKLLTRDLKGMLPHVKVSTASSSEEAKRRIASSGKRFDIIIVEERLKLFSHHSEKLPSTMNSSGSEFIKTLSKERDEGDPVDECLFVALSAHIDQDKEKMDKSGADFVWAKPPPLMDEILRDLLLKVLLVKRHKETEANRLFGGVLGQP